MAAAPVRTYGPINADFCIVTEYAVKCVTMRYGWVTIKCGEMWRNVAEWLSVFKPVWE